MVGLDELRGLFQTHRFYDSKAQALGWSDLRLRPTSDRGSE